MQQLNLDQALRVEDILRSDRQWKRDERIRFARRQLKLAYKNEPQDVPIRKIVLRRLDYDYIDKVNSRE